MPPHRSHVVIGVAGGTGSGKTTVVRKILAALGEAQASVLDHDRYYRDYPDLSSGSKTARV